MTQQWEVSEQVVLSAVIDAEERTGPVRDLDALVEATGLERRVVERAVRLLIEDGVLTGLDASTFGGADWMEIRATRRGMREADRLGDTRAQRLEPESGQQHPDPGDEAVGSGVKMNVTEEQSSAREAIAVSVEPDAAGDERERRLVRSLLTPADAEFISEQSARLAAGDPKAFTVVVRDVIKRMKRLEEVSDDGLVKLHAGAAAASLEVVAAAEVGEFPIQAAEPASRSLAVLAARLVALGLVAAHPGLAVVVGACELVLDHWVATHGPRSE